MIILIVEDEPSIAKLWTMLLASLGKEFRLAHDMTTALREMQLEPFPDLILLDLRLPDSSSEETLASIPRFKAINPEAIVLVVTGNPNPALPVLAAQSGADGFRSKTSATTQAKLYEAVKDAFAASLTKSGGEAKPYQKRVELLERLSAMVT